MSPVTSVAEEWGSPDMCSRAQLFLFVGPVQPSKYEEFWHILKRAPQTYTHVLSCPILSAGGVCLEGVMYAGLFA